MSWMRTLIPYGVFHCRVLSLRYGGGDVFDMYMMYFVNMSYLVISSILCCCFPLLR